jgi:hypothetical protein
MISILFEEIEEVMMMRYLVDEYSLILIFLLMNYITHLYIPVKDYMIDLILTIHVIYLEKIKFFLLFNS